MRQTGGVTKILPAENATPARWLLQSDLDWWDLVRYGPPGFAVYVRIAFPEDYDDEEDDAVRTALAALGSCTSTPATGYAAVWEGWGGNPPPPPAPRLKIPNREMLLFTGPIEVLRDTPALAWRETGSYVPPHLTWPADQAWCLACEVDEEIEFTVGCSPEVAETLASTFPGRTRLVQYGEDAPLYRDEVDTQPQDDGTLSCAEFTYLPLHSHGWAE